MAKRILVVTHNTTLRETRVLVLERGGYSTESVESAEEAMRLLAMERFDLVVIGRRSRLQGLTIDQDIRERYPKLMILQIEPGSEKSSYISRSVTSGPSDVLTVLGELLAGC